MLKIEKAIDIKASVEKVFDYISDPKNLPGIWPSMVEVSDVEKNKLGGFDFSWVYKMLGLHFRGRGAIVEYERPRYYVFKNDVGIPSTFRWAFKQTGNITNLKVETQYTIPTPVLGKLAEHLVHKLNEREAEQLLLNLKTVIEAMPAKETESYARA